MTIQQAIKKAEKIRKDEGVDYSEMTQEEIFMDVAFWQSLGKSLGMDRSDKGICSLTGELEELNPVFLADCLKHRESVLTWRSLWHRFIDHIAEGGTYESFFKDL